jgi:uncharacterized repeat protein (TIGR03803 family)
MLLVLAAPASAQTFRDLIDFTDSSFGDPEYVTLAQSRSGDLYGTTAAAPLTGLGEIFGATTGGKVIMGYDNFDYDNGYHPGGGVTLAANGLLYGTVTYSLGMSGVIYSITPEGFYTVLYQFDALTGSYPYAPPIQGSDGNFYGTSDGYPHGLPSTIYQYQPQTGVVTLLHSFGKEVALYYALTQGIDGDLYGVASTGGPNKFGSIIRLSKAGVLRYVYEFPGGSGGSYPVGPLVQLSDGNFYGVAENGGTASAGFVFKMTPSGTVSTVYNFTGNPQSGFPSNGLTLGSDGQLYGVSYSGGTFDDGTIYRISPSGQYTLLYSFSSRADTLAALTQHTNGTFYGMSVDGGANDFGMMYSLNVNLKPFISFVQPQGGTGQIEQILGQGLTGATSVTFSGVPASSFTIVSDTFMTAVVPSGASTGLIVVTTPTGALTSNKSFQIIP